MPVPSGTRDIADGGTDRGSRNGIAGLSIPNCPKQSIMCWSTQNGNASWDDIVEFLELHASEHYEAKLSSLRDGFSPAVCIELC